MMAAGNKRTRALTSQDVANLQHGISDDDDEDDARKKPRSAATASGAPIKGGAPVDDAAQAVRARNGESGTSSVSDDLDDDGDARRFLVAAGDGEQSANYEPAAVPEMRCVGCDCVFDYRLYDLTASKQWEWRCYSCLKQKGLKYGLLHDWNGTAEDGVEQ